MKYNLRPYQLNAKNQAYQAIRIGEKKIINWMATGAGKGLLMAEYAADVLKQKKRCLIVMRRRDLIFQTRENFKKYRNIDASIIMGKEKGYDKNNPIQICSIDTLRNKIKKEEFQYLSDFEIIQIDECHDTTSPTYQKLFDFLGEKLFLGFTATPFAIGNRPLLFWDRAIKTVDAYELRDQGFLAPCKLFRPTIIDTTGIKKINGDFSNSELFEVVSDLKIVGDAIESYKKYGNGKPFVGFCVNKAHSRLMALAFCDAGIPAIHIDESHNKVEREAAKADIESGKIKGIFNVGIFATGWDCPSLEVLIGLRPTLSEILARQQWGRIFRICPGTGKIFGIILDHANNSSRFGLPYDNDQVACLTHYAHEQKKKQERIDESRITLKNCPDCHMTMKLYVKECPDCGHEFQVIEREIKHEDGELKEVIQDETVDKMFIKIQSHLSTLVEKEKAKGWKSVAKYFMLHDKFGDNIFKYQEKLNIPKWIESAVNKNALIKKCKNCKSYRKSAVHVHGSRFISYDSKIKGYDVGHCSTKGDAVKKDFFCIRFKGK